jgi:hypothetical protein
MRREVKGSLLEFNEKKAENESWVIIRLNE